MIAELIFVTPVRLQSISDGPVIIDQSMLTFYNNTLGAALSYPNLMPFAAD
jgi:hypothetical protein